jgi:hypothetical protein
MHKEERKGEKEGGKKKRIGSQAVRLGYNSKDYSAANIGRELSTEALGRDLLPVIAYLQPC